MIPRLSGCVGRTNRAKVRAIILRISGVATKVVLMKRLFQIWSCFFPGIKMLQKKDSVLLIIDQCKIYSSRQDDTCIIDS